jgi:hypothetical protein
MTRIASLLVALAATACAETPTLRLEITAEADVPDELDQLQVSLAALDGDDTYCRSEGPFLFLLEQAADLPVRVDLEQGETYGRLLAYRVLGFLGGDEVLSREGNARWPDSGKRVVEVRFPSSCYHGRGVPPPCAAPRQCDAGGACEDVPIAGAFDDEATGSGDCEIVGADD